MKEVNRWWKMLHHSAMLPWHAMASTNPCFKPHIHRRMWKKENMMSSWGQNGRNSSISRHLFSSFGRNPIDFCRWRKSGASLLHRAVRRCEISVVQELLVKEAFGFTRGLSNGWLNLSPCCEAKDKETIAMCSFIFQTLTLLIEESAIKRLMAFMKGMDEIWHPSIPSVPSATESFWRPSLE